MQVFHCGGERTRCSEPNCRELARRACGFLLKGAKAGQPCGRALCETHFHPRPDVVVPAVGPQDKGAALASPPFYLFSVPF